MKIKILITLILLFGLLTTGCLTSETKEYKFEFTGKNSGKLTITYRNIMSQRDNEEITVKEEVEKDYEELLNKFIYGTSIEEQYPKANIVSKRLFEDNEQLCGEVILEFDDISDVNLYRYDKKAPYMYYIGSTEYMGLIIENFFDSNGDLGANNFPVVFWDKKLKNLELTTSITEPTEESISLLNAWLKDTEYENPKY